MAVNNDILGVSLFDVLVREEILTQLD